MISPNIPQSNCTDGTFYDTIEIPVHVRDVNCTPVFFQTEDVNAIPGERISIRVRAYDPDNNGSIPTLSVYSTLPDYSLSPRITALQFLTGLSAILRQLSGNILCNRW